jgi:hypothetical protein
MEALVPVLLGVLAVLVALRAAARRRRRGAYDLAGEIGRGDLSDVQGAVRDGERVVLKIPRIDGRNDLPAREKEALDELRAKAGTTVYARYLPEPVDVFVQEGRRINVFRWRPGFRSAEEVRDRFPTGLDGRHAAWMFRRTLEVLGFVHRAGWVHGAVLPPHLLFHPDDHALLLVGWIHAERPGRPLRVVPGAFAAWYPDRGPATPAGDVDLAARSMIWLAGGDPVRGELPKAVPAGLRRFLRGCLRDALGRDVDAWRLHDELDVVLADVYGPPRFVPLILT